MVRPGTTGLQVVWQFGTSHFSFYEVASNGEIPIGQFTHVVGTWDGVTLRLYLNGVLNAQSVPEVTPVDSGCPLNIGGFYHPDPDDCAYVGQFFNGVIDETSLFNRALSPAEVQALFNAGSFGKCGAGCVSYDNFNSTAGLNLIGSATVVSNVLRLTPAIDSQTGDAWLAARQSVAGGFDTTFHFRITTLGNIYGNEPGGDGFTFAIQNLGPTNLSWAMGDTTQFVAVFFNTFWNWPGCTCPDVSGNSVGILVNQTYIAQADLNPLGIDMSDGAVHSAHISYNGAAFSVQVDGVTVLTNVPLAGLQPGVDASGQGWVGFTAGTGAAYENHDILDWSFCAGPTPPSCTPPPSGLVSWWKAENNALDATDGNHGTLAGGTTYVSGKVGQAFDFNGLYSGVQLGNPANLRLQNFTIEAWVKRHSATQATLDGAHPDNGSFLHWSVGGFAFYPANDGRLGLTQVGVSSVSTTTLKLTDTNNFHHVVVTKNGDAVVFYLDGVAETVPPYNPTFTFDQLAIGGRGGDLAASFYGAIDELSVYNRALSPSEVQAIYNAGSDGKCFLAEPPTITSQPASQSVIEGDPVTFTVAAQGTALLTYQWRFNDQPIPGETGTSLVLNNVQSTNAGSYSVVVSNAISFVVSSNAVLTVNPPPPCTEPPSGLVSWWKAEGDASDTVDGNNGTLAGATTFVPGKVGQAFDFNGLYSGVQLGNPANLQLQNFTIEAWVKRHSATQATLDGAHPDNGAFLCWSEGGFAFYPANDGRLGLTHVGFSSVSTTTLKLTDTNNFHHVAVTKNGDTVIFYLDGVAETVAPYNYNPTFGQVAIGARGGDLADAFYGAIDELSVYNRALSSNELAAVYGTRGIGKCLPVLPEIIKQPTNATVFETKSATFTVIATGTPPLTYQWLFNGDPLPGKTNPTLTILNAQQTNAGKYSVIVSNFVGGVVSTEAVLTVLPLPPCTPPPSGLISWWRFENSVLDNWDSNDGTAPLGASFGDGKVGQAFNMLNRAISVADSPSLRLTNGMTVELWVKPNQLYQLTPAVLVGKSANPIDQGLSTVSSYMLGLTNNNRVFFIVSTNGSPRTNITLLSAESLPVGQWSHVAATYDGTALRLYINSNLSRESNYSRGLFPGSAPLTMGALQAGTSSFLWFFNGFLDEVSIYNRALSQNEIQSIYNSDLIGKCLVPPVILTQPLSQTIPQNEDVRFSVVVQGSKPLRYQWQFDGTNILRATNSSLLLEKVQTNRIGFYSVFISNSVGSVLSASAALKVGPPADCTPIPANAISWWRGNNTPLDAIDGNHGSLIGSYFPTGKVAQTFNFDGSSRLQVPNSASLNFNNNVNFTIEGWIKAMPPNGRLTYPFPNTPILEKRTVVVGSGQTFTGQGYSLSLDQGRLAFWIGTNVFTPFPNTNQSTFVSAGPDLRDGMFHHVAVIADRVGTNSGRLLLDGQVVLTFNLTHRKGDLSNVNPLFIGAPTITTSNSFFFGYIDEMAIYNRALTTNEIAAIAAAGSAGKCVGPPFIITQPTNITVRAGSNAVFTALAGGSPNLRYQWFKTNGFQFQAVTGATNSTLVLSNVNAQTAGTYFLRVTNSFGVANSSNAVLTVTQQIPPAGGTLRVDLTGGQPRFQFAGVPGQTYAIEASTNLVDWFFLGTASDLGDGNFEFTDPEWGEYDRCYYRIIVP